MKSLIKSILLICTIVACLWLYFDFTVNKLNKDYLVSYGRGFEQKFSKLQYIETNKIVIVGGSNVNFGIDSDLMEVSLGIPVVNMGLHAGLNTFNIIEPVTPYLKKGDILIISREYNEKLYGASTEVSNYFEFMPLSAKWEVYKNLEAISPVLKSHVQNSQNNIINFDSISQNTHKQGVYTAKAFKNDNVYKNIIDFEMSKSEYKKFKTKDLTPPNNKEVFNYYQKLKKDLNNQGVKVYFSMPAIAKNYFSSEEITTYYKTLSKQTGIELLSNNTFEFPVEKLSNTMYHLNAKGRKERSLSLSNDLAKLLNLKLNTISNFSYASSTIANPTSIEFNDFRQGKLVDNLLTFNHYDKNASANYFRIKTPDSIAIFDGKSFKVVVEGNQTLIKDLKFRAIGNYQEWDAIYINNNKHILIKNNIQGTLFKDGNSYLGISLNNLDKYNNNSVIIHQIEISDIPFDIKPFVDIPLHSSLVVDSRESDSELIIKINQVSNRFNIDSNKKYIIENQPKELLISEHYSDKTFLIKKLNVDDKIKIQFPSDILEVFELQ